MPLSVYRLMICQLFEQTFHFQQNEMCRGKKIERNMNKATKNASKVWAKKEAEITVFFSINFASKIFHKFTSCNQANDVSISVSMSLFIVMRSSFNGHHIDYQHSIDFKSMPNRDCNSHNGFYTPCITSTEYNLKCDASDISIMIFNR